MATFFRCIDENSSSIALNRHFGDGVRRPFEGPVNGKNGTKLNLKCQENEGRRRHCQWFGSTPAAKGPSKAKSDSRSAFTRGRVRIRETRERYGIALFPRHNKRDDDSVRHIRRRG